jgi:hypothetical protein
MASNDDILRAAKTLLRDLYSKIVEDDSSPDVIAKDASFLSAALTAGRIDPDDTVTVKYLVSRFDGLPKKVVSRAMSGYAKKNKRRSRLNQKLLDYVAKHHDRSAREILHDLELLDEHESLQTIGLDKPPSITTIKNYKTPKKRTT